MRVNILLSVIINFTVCICLLTRCESFGTPSAGDSRLLAFSQCSNSRCRLELMSMSSKDSQVEDDGYSVHTRNSFFNLLSRINPLNKPEPGTLILVRHGQTTLNYNKTFTGWIDVDLSENGKREVEHAARLLLERGYTVDVTYTSRLKRAIRSSWIILKELGQIYRPVFKSYRLNERMYGDLEGKSKVQTCIDMGEKEVAAFRTGLYARPPPMSMSNPYWHGNETKYKDLDPADIPLSESLQDTMDRTLPLLIKRIIPDIKLGKTVLVVAHANSLRGVVKHIDDLSEDQITRVGIPNGIPLIFKFKLEGSKLVPVKQELAEAPLSGEFLEKKGLLRKLLAREAELTARVPGFVPLPPLILEDTSTTLGGRLFDRGMSSIEENLTPEKATGAAGEVPGGFETAEERQKQGSLVAAVNDPQRPLWDPVLRALTMLDRDRRILQQADSALWDEALTAPPAPAERVATPLLDQNTLQQAKRRNPTTELDGSGPIVVIIRHGKTEYNKLGLFTGWEDVSLAREGVMEAQAAGKLLKAHGFAFDVVYTSWLSRAIETAWLVLDELDSLWLPIIKTWRLNERMYGALTGLSKQMVAQRHGLETLKKWRRGYANRPPPISSFSNIYPGNDDRYVSNVLDVRYSVFESLIRSIEHGRLELHRKFPKTESLKDCMQRTIPYYVDKIVPDSIAQGKNVLIASSENAIRGLLMHLCEIPTDRIHEVEIPTGLPLVFNVRKKCIQVLDDGLDTDSLDPLARYNFGTSPELLFKPCDMSDSDQCFIGGEGRSYAYDPIIRLKQPKAAVADIPIPVTVQVERPIPIPVAPLSQKLTPEGFDVRAATVSPRGIKAEELQRIP